MKSKYLWKNTSIRERIKANHLTLKPSHISFKKLNFSFNAFIVDSAVKATTWQHRCLKMISSIMLANATTKRLLSNIYIARSLCWVNEHNREFQGRENKEKKLFFSHSLSSWKCNIDSKMERCCHGNLTIDQKILFCTVFSWILLPAIKKSIKFFDARTLIKSQII